MRPFESVGDTARADDCTSLSSHVTTGLQYRQCLEYLDEMTEIGIEKNVIIFGARLHLVEAFYSSSRIEPNQAAETEQRFSFNC